MFCKDRVKKCILINTSPVKQVADPSYEVLKQVTHDGVEVSFHLQNPGIIQYEKASRSPELNSRPSQFLQNPAQNLNLFLRIIIMHGGPYNIAQVIFIHVDEG